MSWTTAQDLREQVLKLWDKGRLLACLVEPGGLFPLRLSLRVPSSADLSERFDEVRKWSHDLQAHAKDNSGYRIVLREVRHRIIGTNSIPREVWIDRLEDAVDVLGTQREIAVFARLLDATRRQHPAVVSWLEASPHRALALEASWNQLLQVITWLKENENPRIYLRQVVLPGIHSKFIEEHQSVLSELADLALCPEAIDVDKAGAAHFARRYGFLAKPTRIRLRGLPPFEDDVTLTAAAFATLDPAANRVYITENEINFLSFPAPPDSLVVFGAGYGFEKLAEAHWLQTKSLYYWGDIDTHGFAILAQLRTVLPSVRSLMMDRDTLFAHREQWGREDAPTSRDLPGLDAAEQDLYDELRQNIHAPNLRLEQERVGFDWVKTQVERSSPYVDRIDMG